MSCETWQYYNHAAIPTCAPHEEPDMEPIENGSIWNDLGGGKPLFARWSTDWDCGYETDWWHIVLDTPFDISRVSKHIRHQINVGLRNYECRRINPADYSEQMADIALKDFAAYPKSYRPNFSREKLVKIYSDWRYITYGAFDSEDQLCAFNGIKDCGTYYLMVHRKSIPEKQKGQLNKALIYTNITSLSEEIAKGKYLTNGQRNLNHQTNYNENLCNYFGFRKAYCHLHVEYNPKIKLIVKIMYPFRKLFLHFDSIGIFHAINVVMKMEEICRKDNDRKDK